MTHLTFRTTAAVLLIAAACKPSSARSGSAPAVDTPAAPATAVADTGTNPMFARADSARIAGADTASVWVIEVSDFQCPFCGDWHRTYGAAFERELVQSGRVRFAYVNMPLDIHRNAWPAAEAAMCAAAQGRFWPVHNALFETQERWAQLPEPDPVLDSLVQAAGVDMARYRTCRETHAMRPLIQADYDRAVSARIRSTPSFIIGSHLLTGEQPLDAIRRAVDEAASAAH